MPDKHTQHILKKAVNDISWGIDDESLKIAKNTMKESSQNECKGRHAAVGYADINILDWLPVEFHIIDYNVDNLLLLWSITSLLGKR